MRVILSRTFGHSAALLMLPLGEIRQLPALRTVLLDWGCDHHLSSATSCLIMSLTLILFSVRCRPKQCEPQPGAYYPFDGLLALFNEVVELLDRASFNTSLVLLVYEPAMRQLGWATMLSSCSFSPVSPAAPVLRSPYAH
jgi:hypothetical protein